MHDTAIQLGKDTQFSAKQAADGMAALGQAGFSTQQIIAAMPGTLNLAAAGELSIADAAKDTVNTLGQFNLTATDSSHVADVFAKAAAASQADVNDLAEALKLVGPVAHVAGISLEDTTAAIATLSQGGIKASEAGTGLRGVIAALEKPSREAKAALDDLGISTKDAAGNMLPLDNIMGQLKESGANAADMFAIFRRENVSAASVLKDNIPVWQNMTKEIDNSAGAAAKMAATLRQGVAGDFEQLKGSIETAGIALGETLAPAIDAVIQLTTTLANYLIDGIKWFQTLSPAVQAAVGTFVALAAAIGPIILGIGTVITVVTTLGPALAGMAEAMGTTQLGMVGLSGGVALLLAGLVALGVYIYTHWNEITVAFIGQVLKMETAIRNWLQALPGTTEMVKNLNEVIKRDGEEVATAAKKMDDAAKSAAKLKQEQEDLKKKIADGTKVITAHGEAADTAAAGITKVGTAAKATAKGTVELQKATKEYIPPAGTLGDALNILSTKHKDLITQQRETNKQLEDGAKKFAEMNPPIVSTATALKDTWVPAMQAAGKALDDTLPKITSANGAQSDYYDGLAKLGIKGHETYNQLATDAQTAYDKIVASGEYTTWEKNSAFLKLLEAQRAAMISNGETVPAAFQKQIDDLNKIVDDPSRGLPATKGKFDDFAQSVSTAITNFSQDITKSLFEGDGSWGEKGKKALAALGEATANMFIEPATKAIAGFISGAIKDLLGGDGLGGLLDSITNIGKGITNIFSSASSVPVPGTIPGVPVPGSPVPGVTPPPSGAASAAGAASGFIPIAGLVTGAISAVSGVVSNFQMAGMNKSLDLIVKHTLQTANDMANLRKDEWDRFGSWMLIKDDILNRLNTMMDNTNLFVYKFDDCITALQGVGVSAGRAADSLDALNIGMVNNSEREAAYLDRISAALDRVAATTERTLNVNLAASDPSLVASRIAQQLRMQGGTA